MALSPELQRWLSALSPSEVKKLSEFAGRGSLKNREAVAYLAGLGDQGLRDLDSRWRAAVAAEPPAPPSDVPPPPSDEPGPGGEPPPPPAVETPPSIPAPPSGPVPTPEPERADAVIEGGRSVSPGAPVAGDPRVSPVAPPRERPDRGEKPQETDLPAPGAPRGYMVRLKVRRILEIGCNGETATLNGKRFAGPFSASFMEYLANELGTLGIEFEAVRG